MRYACLSFLLTLAAVVALVLLDVSALDANRLLEQANTTLASDRLSHQAGLIAAGTFHTCVVIGGGIKCWGNNDYGQLGDGTYTRRTTPVSVVGLAGTVTQISTDSLFTCAVVSGAAYCWGENGYGQLGDGTTVRRNFPVTVQGLTSGVIQVAAGGYHACALLSSGHDKCWGGNRAGQIGDGTYNNSRYTPVEVLGLPEKVVSISAGGEFTCALLASEHLMCWGYNGFGQLGNGGGGEQHLPVFVSGLASESTFISAGIAFACAMTNHAGLLCWGQNLHGQLGDGSGSYLSLVPVQVARLAQIPTTVSAGAENACAVLINTTVQCWGYNAYRQLGNGTLNDSPFPTNVVHLASALAVATGWTHTCALILNEQVMCWGRNENGQLGNGSFQSTLVPVAVTGLGYSEKFTLYFPFTSNQSRSPTNR